MFYPWEDVKHLRTTIEKYEIGHRNKDVYQISYIDSPYPGTARVVFELEFDSINKVVSCAKEIFTVDMARAPHAPDDKDCRWTPHYEFQLLNGKNFISYTPPGHNEKILVFKNL